MNKRKNTQVRIENPDKAYLFFGELIKHEAAIVDDPPLSDNDTRKPFDSITECGHMLFKPWDKHDEAGFGQEEKFNCIWEKGVAIWN